MTRKDQIRDLLRKQKVVFAMLHLKGESREEILARAIKESRELYAGGVDAVIIENYFGDYDDMKRILEYYARNYQDRIYGVNALDNDPLGFQLARDYQAYFVQVDSVSGHLEPQDDPEFEAMINEERARTDAFLFGGVRFKYQPYLSGRSLAEDLKFGMARCDGIVVTGDATGDETPIAKLKEFRSICGEDFPLLVGSGSTPQNIGQLLEVAEGAIVGSYFKDTYKDTGDVSIDHVRAFMKLVRGV